VSASSTNRPRSGRPRQFDPRPDPPAPVPDEVADLTFTIEAVYGGKRRFDFRDLKPSSLARLFATALRDAAATSGTIRAITTVIQYENAIRKFFFYLAGSDSDIFQPSDLRSHHIDGFEQWLQSLGKKPIHRQVILSKPINCLRLAEAMFPNLLDSGLCERLRYVSDQSAGRSIPRDAYSPFVARQLRNAARTDIALIRARYDEPIPLEANTACRWDTIDAVVRSEGVVGHTHRAFKSLYMARYKLGMPTHKLIEDIHRRHYLLAKDIVPFLVLLSLETGLEIECCKDLTIDCLKNPAKNSIEIMYVKRRARGAEWKKLRVPDQGPLSPGGLIRTMIHLTVSSRRHKPSDSLWLYFDHGALTSGIKHPRANLDAWVQNHTIVEDSGTPLYLLLSRLRKTQKALWYLKSEGEIKDFAIGHTPEIAARHYADIPALRHVHENSVAHGLQDALDSALKPCVLAPDEEEQLRQGKQRADLPLQLNGLTMALDGKHDVWLASCSGFYESPFGQPGQPCPQPFWGCFECQNAVITARKLPAILLFLEFITAQRATLSESHWVAKFGRVWSRITTQILPAFPSAVVEDAALKKITLKNGLYLPPEMALT